MIDLCSRSLADTHDIAAAIAQIVRPRDILVLSGDMGAGKTAFVAGFARGLGVSDDEYVSSPTFTLVHTHETGRIPMYHADLYRLTSTGEIADLVLYLASPKASFVSGSIWTIDGGQVNSL